MSFKPACSSIGDEELALFREYLRERSGIVVPPEKAYLFETRLSRMMALAGFDSFGAFYGYVASGADPGMERKIVDAMTVGETLWFRDAFPWKVLEERVLPRLAGELASGRRARARIWCAAAATGQEAYSTAMCVDDYLERHPTGGVALSDFDIFATDISGRALDAARRGRYDAISMTRGLSDYHRTKYFTRDNTAWDLDPRIRGAVRFARFNLQEDYGAFGTFDVIFCRYVLIYFSSELKREVLSKMRDSLAEDGVLFTGNYALLGIAGEYFDPVSYENSTYYIKNAKKAVGG